MTDANDPIRDAEVFLALHVEERRRIIREALDSHGRGGSGLAGREIQEIQDQIRAIQELIQDERSDPSNQSGRKRQDTEPLQHQGIADYNAQRGG